MCAETPVQLARATVLSVRLCTSGYLGPELRWLIFVHPSAHCLQSWCPQITLDITGFAVFC